MTTMGPPPEAAVAVSAPAKLTLSLRVTGVRADGYHLLEAEMVSVDLADTLSFSAGDGLEVVVEGPARSSGFGAIPVDGSNLVSRALSLVGRAAHVHLVKRIPAGAGLGGGSTDAAAVLRWAGFDRHDYLRAAGTLGSDVPFCLAGGGHARVSGAGEILTPLSLADVAGRSYTLLVPPFGVSTAAVYRAWDALSGPVGDNFNDLEPAALTVEPRLAAWRDRLGNSTGEVPRLAGSGSTWFVAGAYPGGSRIVVRAGPEVPPA